MKRFVAITLIIITAFLGISAREKQDNGAAAHMPIGQPIPMPDVRRIGSELPKAVVYSMNGNWAQHVPVTLSADGKTLISFPAVTDITDSQTPVSVGDGLWLDRRGIGKNTAFTRWTYAEYSALDRTPAPSEILSNLIPGARVTEIVRLPMTATAAANDPEAVRCMIAEGLHDAVIIYRLPGTAVPGTIQQSTDAPATQTVPATPQTPTIERGEPGPNPILMTKDPVCR